MVSTPQVYDVAPTLKSPHAVAGEPTNVCKVRPQPVPITSSTTVSPIPSQVQYFQHPQTQANTYQPPFAGPPQQTPTTNVYPPEFYQYRQPQQPQQAPAPHFGKSPALPYGGQLVNSAPQQTQLLLQYDAGQAINHSNQHSNIIGSNLVRHIGPPPPPPPPPHNSYYSQTPPFYQQPAGNSIQVCIFTKKEIAC